MFFMHFRRKSFRRIFGGRWKRRKSRRKWRIFICHQEVGKLFSNSIRAKVFLETLAFECKIYISERMNVTLYLYLGRGRKRKKVQEDSEDGEESGSEVEGSDDDRPKKRGRPRVLPRETIKSFTDVEVLTSFILYEII